MHLFLEEEADCWRNNLSTIDKIAIIIPNKYNRASFQNIILIYWQSENNVSIFQNISTIRATYMSLHYMLLFPYGDLRQYQALRLYNLNNLSKNSCIT